MLNFNSILVGSENPKTLGAFYEKILGHKPEWQEHDWFGFKIGDGFIAVGPHTDVKGKNKDAPRIIMNWETADVKGEFEKIRKLGARIIAKPYQPKEAHDMWIATFSDPDGNYFQLMSPMSENK